MKNSIDEWNSWLDIVEGNIDKLEGKFEKDSRDTKRWKYERSLETQR